MAEKLNEDKIKEISQLSSSGKTQTEIWKLLGVSRTTVNKYLSKIKQWTNEEMMF